MARVNPGAFMSFQHPSHNSSHANNWYMPHNDHEHSHSQTAVQWFADMLFG